jgi:hypothetical protein
LRIQSEGFELSAPFRGSVAEPLDTNAAGQTTFDRGFNQVWCEERERDGHIDLSHAATLQSPANGIGQNTHEILDPAGPKPTWATKVRLGPQGS